MLENIHSDAATSFCSGNNFITNRDGIALNEIITEMKTARLIYSNNKFKPYENINDRYILKTDGYQNITFIGTMLCSSLGISQLDFLKAADNGKQNFINTMAKKFYQKEDCENFINNISSYSDQLFAITYRNRSNESPSAEKEAQEAANSCISDIYTQCIQAMEKTMLNNISKNKNSMDINEYMKKCRFNLASLTANYKYGMETNLGKCDIDLSENTYLLNLQKRILAIETIINGKENLTPNQYDEALSNISTMEIVEDQKLQTLYKTYNLTQTKGIDSFDEIISDEYIDKFSKEEYGDSAWPNKKLTKHINNFLDMNTWTYKTFSQLKEFILYLKEKKQHSSSSSLPPSPNQISDQAEELENLTTLVNDTPDYESSPQSISIPDIDIKKVEEERQ